MPNYQDLLNVDDFWEKRENFDPDRWGVVFYCKDCEDIVEVDRVYPEKYIFKCRICWGNNIAIW